MTSLQRYRTEGGARVALVGEAARLYTPLVFIDSPIKVHKVANGSIDRYTQDITQGERAIKPTARAMLRAGKTLGITKGAKKFLRAIALED